MSNLSCNLECVKNKEIDSNVHEFIGPVKIRLIDTPPAVYFWRRMQAALITLMYFLMGATVMTVLFFTLSFKLPDFMNMHVFLCTCGYQLCIPSGILILNNLSSSHVVTLSDRKFEHFCTQIFGFGIAAAGSVLVFMSKIEFTLHSVTGIIAGVFGSLNMLLGPLICCFNTGTGFMKWLKKLHMAFGGLCFLFSSLCFLHGLVRPCMYEWVPLKSMVMFLFGFCVFYTILISRNVLQSYTNIK